jgi:flagellar hook-associated protein 1 FlgK
MGLLNSALQIGRSALLGYEAGLHVIGGNISSAGSPDYTRLSPELDPLQGPLISRDLQPGAGVALTAIRRNIDETLESRIRLAIGANSTALVQQDALAQIEPAFDDLTGSGVGAKLMDFFHAFDELQNTPEDLALRDLVVARGVALADSLQGLRAQLTRLSEGIDAQITTVVAQADGIARDIARLNQEITRLEAGSRGQATGLRDQRDGLLRKLSELFEVTVREQPNGSINVYVGSETLVQGSTVRGLVAVREVDGETTRTSVRFADTNQQVELRIGTLAGLILSRDQNAQIQQVDQLAAAVIAAVNRIHADGQGLAGFTSVSGTYDVLETDVPLDSDATGLSIAPRNGSFYVTVADTVTNTPKSFRIDVPLDGTAGGVTLQGLVDDFNAQVVGVRASITSDHRLQFTADDGFTFTFGYDGQEPRADTSGVLAAMGLNTFFTGTDARNIAVNDSIVKQPALIAAATSYLPGDGSNSVHIAALDTTLLGGPGSTTLVGMYKGIANDVAVRAAAVREEAESTATVLGALQVQRENLSGVNLDEEAISLVKFERAYQGAARFVSVVNGLVGELVQLIR